MLLSGGAYAFTASNTVAATTAGNGSGTVSGYTVSGVTYTLSNSADGGTAASPVITAVSFALSAEAVAANVSAVISGSSSTSEDYNPCTNSGGTTTSGETSGGTWTCDLSGTAGEPVADATTLTVTAAQ
jgi:hypothetical protein